MKSLSSHILEKLIINKDFENGKLTPKDDYDLKHMISERVEELCEDRNWDGYLDLTDINIKNVKHLSNTFFVALKNNAWQVKRINVTGWDTSHIIYFDRCFYNCIGVNLITGLSTWDMSSAVSLDEMFKGCGELMSIKGIRNWSTQKVSLITGMFSECRSLPKIDISRWNTESLISTSNMFNECERLETIGDISDWNITKLVNTNNMFTGCKRLQFTGNLEKWASKPPKYHKDMFKYCPREYKRPRWSKK